MKKQKKEYTIISKDRHRDDEVYIFEGTEEEVKKKAKEIFEKDFGVKLKDGDDYLSLSGGDYEVNYVETIRIK